MQKYTSLVATAFLLSTAWTFSACGGGGEAPEVKVKANPTYYEDIAPIVQGRCVTCHSEGNIAPFALETYEQARDAAPSMAAATGSRRMPPWGVDSSGECNTWRDDLSLSDVQIKLIANWSNTGAPMGDPAHAPPPAGGSDSLEKVSITIGLPGSYDPNAAQADDYRCFVIDPGLTSDKFLTAYEVHPGEPHEVHHVVVWAHDTASDDTAATNLDNGEAGLGYSCFGGAGTLSPRTLLAWAPGQGVTRYPAGSGLRLAAGRKLVMQVHYNLLGAPKPDLTTIDFTLADTVEKEGLITGVADWDLNLPPGTPKAIENASIPLPTPLVPVSVHGVWPHMHKYGRTMKIELLQGFTSTCLADVPRYSFEWQRFYFYKNPVVIPTLPGAFTITCTYDTTGAMNTVHFGEETGDEMCIGGLYVTY